MDESLSANASVEILESLKTLDMLPHFPDALLKLDREISNNQDVTVEQIADLVTRDARLLAGIIKLANSAKFNAGKEVTSLEEAIVKIGFKELANFAYALHYQTSFSQKPPFSDRHYINHSMMSAIVGQHLARHLKLDAGVSFLSALMRDIGIYLLAMHDRDKYKEVLRLTNYDIARLPAAESKMFGTYHPMVGARLLQDWKFPVEVIMGVAFHHTPARASEGFQPNAYLTFLAEQGVFRLGYENGIADLSAEDQSAPSAELISALNFFDLSVEQYDQILQSALIDIESIGI